MCISYYPALVKNLIPFLMWSQQEEDREILSDGTSAVAGF